MSRPVAFIASSSDDDIGIGTLLKFKIQDVLNIVHSESGIVLTVEGTTSTTTEQYSAYDVSVVYDDGDVKGLYESDLADIVIGPTPPDYDLEQEVYV